ncbi:MAG: hypothetical protein DRN11_02375 [Thermoplasmata archaeon]|nr:MAG: hypothetical protein DRN11_02375 [Thermoplasmata archaeon]
MLKLIMKNGMEYLWNSIKICLLLSLKAIIFAKDANMNPFPPTFTPYAILSQSLEKFDNENSCRNIAHELGKKSRKQEMIYANLLHNLLY